MAKVDWRELAALAEEARKKAYAPYSKYRVGAALIAHDADGKSQVFTGANMENASYGLCVCAERNAVASAVFAGMRELIAIAIATEGPEPGAPCGMCRQVLSEFARDVPVALVVRGEIRKKTSLAKLLPDAFGGRQLGVVSASSRLDTEPRNRRAKTNENTAKNRKK